MGSSFESSVIVLWTRRECNSMSRKKVSKLKSSSTYQILLAKWRYEKTRYNWNRVRKKKLTRIFKILAINILPLLLYTYFPSERNFLICDGISSLYRQLCRGRSPKSKNNNENLIINTSLRKKKIEFSICRRRVRRYTFATPPRHPFHYKYPSLVQSVYDTARHFEQNYRSRAFWARKRIWLSVVLQLAIYFLHFCSTVNCFLRLWCFVKPYGSDRTRWLLSSNLLVFFFPRSFLLFTFLPPLIRALASSNDG